MRTSKKPTLETAAAGLLMAGLAASPRLALANFVLGLGFLAWVGAMAGRRMTWPVHPTMLPLLALVLWSLVSAAFARDPATSYRSLDGMITVLLFPMVVALMRPDRWTWTVRLLGLSSLLSSGIALGQILVNGVDLEHRAPGVFSHYMTFAGWTMIVVLILVGEALVGEDRTQLRWILPLLGLHSVVLALSLTRNAWMGIAVALGTAVIVFRTRALMAFPLIVVIGVALVPGAVRDRVASITDLDQLANRDRVAMMNAGQAMIAEHPLVGVGPDMIKTVYPDFRQPDAVRKRVSHLHCNPIHIAAERGLPALGMYLWLLVAFGCTVARGLKDPNHPARSALMSCLLAVVGVTVAGLFEYNWGDTEIWLLTLFVLATPAGLERR